VRSIQCILHILSFVSSFNNPSLFLNLSHHILDTVVKSSLQIASLFVIHLVSLKHPLVGYHLDMSMVSGYDRTDARGSLRRRRWLESSCKTGCLGR
jgi:hypothetical protein